MSSANECISRENEIRFKEELDKKKKVLMIKTFFLNFDHLGLNFHKKFVLPISRFLTGKRSEHEG